MPPPEKRAAVTRRPKSRSLNTRIPRRLYRLKNQRLAPSTTLLCACAVGVSPCTSHHCVAPCRIFLLSRVSHLAIVPGVTRTMRRRKCTVLRPHPTHTTLLPFTRKPRVGGPPKTRQRRCLPPAVAPSQSKTPKTRDLLPSIAQESRMLDLKGRLDFRDARTFTLI